jgi:signal transduction histidine kinase
MVDILFRDGNTAGAIRLEELWNNLAHRHSFDLLCAYAIGNFYTEAHAEQLKDICDRHTEVVPTESYSLLPDDRERARKVIDLQQRARSLEVEIEHRKAIEHALREALAERQRAIHEAERASTAKSEFLAIISHELRTPLTAIIGYEELIEHGVGGPVTEQQQTFLSGIKSGASHLLRLIDQILTQSRVSAGKETLSKSEVNLNEVVRACAALMQPVATERGLQLTVEMPDAIVAFTDEGKVQQILLNLLSNALKFTPQGGIAVRLNRKGGRISCEVCDTGVGISEADLERVFEAFEQIDTSATRTHSGVGLGLSVSRDLAELLGGNLTAQSSPGLGSTFRLELPVA